MFRRRRPDNLVLRALLNKRPFHEVQNIIITGTDLNLLGRDSEEFGSLIIIGLFLGISDALLTQLLSHPWFQQVNRVCPTTGGTALHIAATLERKTVAYSILERHDFQALFVKDLRNNAAIALCRQTKMGRKIKKAIEKHPLYRLNTKSNTELSATCSKILNDQNAESITGKSENFGDRLEPKILLLDFATDQVNLEDRLKTASANTVDKSDSNSKLKQQYQQQDLEQTNMIMYQAQQDSAQCQSVYSEDQVIQSKSMSHYQISDDLEPQRRLSSTLQASPTPDRVSSIIKDSNQEESDNEVNDIRRVSTSVGIQTEVTCPGGAGHENSKTGGAADNDSVNLVTSTNDPQNKANLNVTELLKKIAALTSIAMADQQQNTNDIKTNQKKINFNSNIDQVQSHCLRSSESSDLVVDTETQTTPIKNQDQIENLNGKVKSFAVSPLLTRSLYACRSTPLTQFKVPQGQSKQTVTQDNNNWNSNSVSNSYTLMNNSSAYDHLRLTGQSQGSELESRPDLFKQQSSSIMPTQTVTFKRRTLDELLSDAVETEDKSCKLKKKYNQNEDSSKTQMPNNESHRTRFNSHISMIQRLGDSGATLRGKKIGQKSIPKCQSDSNSSETDSMSSQTSSVSDPSKSMRSNKSSADEQLTGILDESEYEDSVPDSNKFQIHHKNGAPSSINTISTAEPRSQTVPESSLTSSGIQSWKWATSSKKQQLQTDFLGPAAGPNSNKVTELAVFKTDYFVLNGGNGPGAVDQDHILHVDENKDEVSSVDTFSTTFLDDLELDAMAFEKPWTSCQINFGIEEPKNPISESQESLNREILEIDLKKSIQQFKEYSFGADPSPIQAAQQNDSLNIDNDLEMLQSDLNDNHDRALNFNMNFDNQNLQHQDFDGYKNVLNSKDNNDIDINDHDLIQNHDHRDIKLSRSESHLRLYDEQPDQLKIQNMDPGRPIFSVWEESETY